MSWIEVTFEPLDVLAATDARPLDIGGTAHLGALAPAAFAGVIRTEILRRAQFGFPRSAADFGRESAEAQAAATLIGHPFAPVDPNGAFQVAAPFVRSVEGNPFLPLPRASVWDGVHDALKEQLAPSPSDDVLCDERFEGLSLLSGERDRETDPRWGSLETICYLLGNAARGDSEVWKRVALRTGNYRHVTAFREIERHWGHRRSDAGVAAESTLWSRQVERFSCRVRNGPLSSAAYLGLMRGTDAKSSCQPFVGRLGGDGHLVRVSCAPAGGAYDAVKRLRDLVRATRKTLRGLLLYLATPAVFDEGWRPPVGADDGLRLIAAAVGRPLAVGGWDLAKRRPKAITRAVPAGSTYFFAIDDDAKADAFIERHHWNRALSRPGTEREGFGLALCGVWDLRYFSNGGS